MSNKNNKWLIILGALAALGFIWAWSERNKRKAVEESNSNLERDYLHLLEKYLDKTHSIPKDIKNQIINLRKRFIGLEDKIAIELQTVVELLEINKEDIAIEKLTKIIENILKDKYIENGLAKDKRSCPKLYKMIEKSLELNWINKHPFNFSLLLKDNRNDEAHELATNYPTNWKLISFIAGIDIIYTLKGFEKS